MREVMTYLLTNNLVEAEKEILRLKDENAELTKALTGLTCGGSEFFVRKGDRYVADIDACVSWVRRAKEDAHRRALDAIKARQASVVENEKLRAALEEAVGAWRPIETAPTDGTAILGGYFNQPWADSHRNGDIVRCWFQPEFDAFISSCRQMVMAPGYTFGNGKTSELHSPVVEAVSHWMPLPPPPGGEHPQQSGGAR